MKKPPRDASNLRGQLPTDTCRAECSVPVQNYMTILEDMLLNLQTNLAIGKGFNDLELPVSKPSFLERSLSKIHLKVDDQEENTKKFIDLWPIQMSAEIDSQEGERRNIVTTNFDTYTLILQLGCILHTVPSWRRAYKLRVAVFVEYEADVEEERARVTALLTNLRIEAQVLVFWLASGNLESYEIIVNGNTDGISPQSEQFVDEALKSEEWWKDVQTLRGCSGDLSATQELAEVENLLDTAPNWPSSSFQHGRKKSTGPRFGDLKKILRGSKSRASIGELGSLGVSMGMKTHRLDPDIVDSHAIQDSGSEGSDSSDDEFAQRKSYDSTLSPPSETAIDDGDDDDETDEEGDEDIDRRRMAPERRSRSLSIADSMRISFFKNFSLRPPSRKRKPRNRQQNDTKQSTTGRPRSESPAQREDLSTSSASRSGASDAAVTRSGPKPAQRRPDLSRHDSHPNFTSRPVPQTKIASEDGPGPSIMFSEDSKPSNRLAADSIYAHRPSHNDVTDPTVPDETSDNDDRPAASASGFPASAAVPLSFNDLPCRAQHLILNELMRSLSEDTAVVFTTLPAPAKGTCLSEEDSVRYLSELEVLCQDLPPVLLVHSNSMTVTMNL